MTAIVELRRAEKEFGVDGLMMAVNTRNGVYGCLSVLNESGNLLERWLRTERDSLHIRNSVTAPSSAALILQIWLHTICLWKRRCLSRKVEQRIVHANGEQESVRDIRECLNTSKQTIVDLKKGIVVYVNDGGGKLAFAGFCVLQSERCGHFRHLQSGRVVYVRPTTVHYKKLNPEKAISQTAKPVIYRNTEDFLREKSYLENDVLMMLKCNGIEYQREKMFPWMGKKRLDFFLPGKNIAIECQGVQHFYPYGSDDKDFEARKQRDADKYNECTSNGVQVLYYMSELIPVPGEMARKYQYVTSLDELLAKREKVVIAAESGKKMTALAAMYASERGYSFIPVANDDLPTYLAKQQQKGCVMFDRAENNEKSKTPVVSCAYRCGTVDWKERKTMMYQKLVRDNIPAIIEKNGKTCVTRTLSDKEYEDALTNKLQEEVAELLEAYTAKERSVLDCAEEMADVMEVMYAMGKTCAVSKREIEQVRSQKAAEKGTFSKKIFLVSTEK